MAIHIRRREFIGALGGAATWPLMARAQQAKKIPTIGVLWHSGSAEEEAPYFNAVIQGFRSLGYVEGRNIRFEHRFPNDTPDRFRSLAAELVSLKVDVIVAWGGATAPYAKDATTTIPIVFGLDPDPVGNKLVASFARPGDNITGFTSFVPDLAQKRLQYLKEVVPGLSHVGLLVRLAERNLSLFVSEITEGARRLGLTLQTFDVRSLSELDQTFDAMDRSGIQGVIPQGGLMFQGKAIIAKLALTHHVPMCVWSRESLEVGALMSYGPDYVTIAHRVGIYVDKILKGAKPADLPVEQPTKVELLLNSKTAKALGIDFPPHLLVRADEVIE
jgi:putative ABC transport system substrate-binding protein